MMTFIAGVIVGQVITVLLFVFVAHRASRDLDRRRNETTGPYRPAERVK